MRDRMTVEEVKRVYGVDPAAVGLRNRGWWIVDKVEDEEECGNAQVGDLCVKARDGGSNPLDPSGLASVAGALSAPTDTLKCKIILHLPPFSLPNYLAY